MKLKYDNYNVCCPNEKLSGLLLRHLRELGYYWNSGHSLSTFTLWDNYREKTVYVLTDGKVTVSGTPESPGRYSITVEEILGAQTPEIVYKGLLGHR